MKLYRKVDENGLFIEDVLLEDTPFLTTEVADIAVDEEGNFITLDTTHKEIETEEVIENVVEKVFNEETGEYDDVVTPTPKQVPVRDKHYIETPCPDGFYHPKWDWDNLDWIEGGQVPEESYEQQIARLKSDLESTDYKIVKCSEYQILGKVMPYDVELLHIERQALRDSINNLETQFNQESQGES